MHDQQHNPLERRAPEPPVGTFYLAEAAPTEGDGADR